MMISFLINKKIKRVMYVTAASLLLLIPLFIPGCSKNIDLAGPMPDIIWPKPPNVPRIHFVKSVSTPDDLNISKSGFKKLLSILWGPTSSPLVSPHGIAVDRDGRIFVIDKKFGSIKVYDVNAGEHYTVTPDDSGLVAPVDVAVDNNGSIFVSDAKAAVVRVFADNGRRLIKELGKGVLKRPTGVAVNEKTGELLVVDTLSSEIVRYGLDDLELKGRWGGSGDVDGMLHFPTSISVSRNGDIIVSDSLNFRVQKFTSEGEFLVAFGEAGNKPGYFSRPKGVASDSDGNIYVVDALFDNVQMFDKDGRLLMAFGRSGQENGEFWLPSEIFIDSNNMIYVADTYNKMIQVFQYMNEDW